jgi:serine/threonine protein kinase
MLAGNKLKSLPPAMAACLNLGLLRIAANELTELPEWLFSLPQLAWLACAGNPFSYSAPVSNTLPEIFWSDLVLGEQLGQGASGVIYKGEWKTPEAAPKTQAVAIKIFKGEVTSDGLPADEMRACMAVGAHPNLVPVLGKIGKHPAQKKGLVLELIPPNFKILGNTPSLETCTRDYYNAGTSFTLKQLLTIASGTAAAVAQLHAQGIMHGDLYAHNILVNETAKPLFGDFGAASFYDKTDKEQAVRLERLEVRAFGYLLEDLINHLESRDSNQPSITIINNLKEACLHSDILQRPDFALICEEIEHATTVIHN